MWLPGTAAAMPAIIASRVRSISSATCGRRLADVEGPGAVAMPAVDDRAGVDRHDLAGADRPLARDAVDDLVVDRDAHAGRERPARVDARVALERRGRPGGPDVRLGDGVEVGGRDARPELGLDHVEDLARRRDRRAASARSRARDLRVTIVRPRPRRASAVHQRLGHRVDRPAGRRRWSGRRGRGSARRPRAAAGPAGPSAPGRSPRRRPRAGRAPSRRGRRRRRSRGGFETRL